MSSEKLKNVQLRINVEPSLPFIKFSLYNLTFCLHVCLHTVYAPGSWGGQKVVLERLRLEMVGSHGVGSGSRTRVLLRVEPSPRLHPRRVFSVQVFPRRHPFLVVLYKDTCLYLDVLSWCYFCDVSVSWRRLTSLRDLSRFLCF